MWKILLLIIPFIASADPGITVEIDVFIEKPSGPSEETIG